MAGPAPEHRAGDQDLNAEPARELRASFAVDPAYRQDLRRRTALCEHVARREQLLIATFLHERLARRKPVPRHDQHDVQPLAVGLRGRTAAVAGLTASPGARPRPGSRRSVGATSSLDLDWNVIESQPHQISVEEAARLVAQVGYRTAAPFACADP